MKEHAKHLLMCAPMIVVGIILIATGSSIGILVPLLACTAMMWAMMSMGGGEQR